MRALRPLALACGALLLAASVPSAQPAQPAQARTTFGPRDAGAPARDSDSDDDAYDYAADVAFALDALEEQCGRFFDLKGIDWKAVRREMTKAAKHVETPADHLVLLVRLLARLKDGHAQVRPLAAGQDVAWPDPVERVGPGLFLCRVDKSVYVKNAWSSAAELGIVPGMEVLKIDGAKPLDWLEARVARNADLVSFSTEQHAFFHTCHQGLAEPPGTRLELELREPAEGRRPGKKRKRTITYHKASVVPDGPAFAPEGLEWIGKGLRWGKTPAGHGYVHVRRVPGDVIEALDEALGKLGRVPGLVLDFRGNSGGGCDHDAFEARFVPAGRELERLARPPLPSAGPHAYGGPMVVIFDGTTKSSGETLAGTFQEDGRAWSIGESATAGMSSQKTTIELPSGLFALYVSVGSNRSSFNGGRGIEGIGVTPLERLDHDPRDLAAGVDTFLRRADELLADFPQQDVRYDPAEHGWTPPQ